MFAILLIIILIVILAIIFIPAKNYILTPSTFKGTYRPYTQLSQLAYTVYFPLKNIDNISSFEEELINNNRIATFQEIREKFVDLEKRDKCMEWLNQNGQVTFTTDTGTMAIWLPSSQFIQSLSGRLYVSPLGMAGTVNDYYDFPYGMKVFTFNYSNAEIERKTFKEWTSTLNLTKNPIQPVGYSLNKINSFSKAGNYSIGIINIGSQIISHQTLDVFTEFYNTNYGTTYSPEHFYNLVNYFYIDIYGNPVSVPLFSNTYDYDIENNPEAIIDIFTCLQINPETPLYINTCNDILDPNIVTYIGISETSTYTWTSSYGFSSKTHPLDYQRFRYESRFIGMLGVTLFAASTDQGSWSSALGNDNTLEDEFDVLKPDLGNNVFFGDGVITVGGIHKQEESFISMNFKSGFLNVYNINYPAYEMFIFGTGGGFMRGYLESSFKKDFIKTYKYPSSICQHMLSNGEITKLNCEYQVDGKAIPDIINEAYIGLPNRQEIATGTSVSSPYTAAHYNLFLLHRKENGHDVVPCFYRLLYTNKFNQYLERPLTGRLSLYNLLGYRIDPDALWDPGQGRGYINFSELENDLNGSLEGFF
jgi:hypothetical protein